MQHPPRLGLPPLLCILAFFGVESQVGRAADVRPALVIDTDAALDDLRALALLAGDPAIEIRALVLTEPVQGSDQAARDVRSILEAAGRAEAPVVVDPQRELNSALGDATDALTWVALAPLTTLATWLEGDESRASRLAALHWSGGLPYDDRPGENIERDIVSARKLFESGIQIRALALFERERLFYDSKLHAELSASDEPLAHAVVEAHAGEANATLIAQGQLVMRDDAVALDMLEPELVEGGRKGQSSAVVEKWNKEAARRAFVERITARP